MTFSKKLKEIKQEVLRDSAEAFQSLDEISEANTLKVLDAMRECIGGMYQNTFAICMLELLIFVVAGLLIGLIIRVPFIHLNHFIEKRMEDTKVL